MHGYQEGHAASPIIVGDRLVVGFGKLRALNKNSGEILWEGRKFRDFGTPAHIRVHGEDLVVTAYGEVYRLRDGAVLTSDLGEVIHLGPVAEADTLYFVGSDFGRAMSVGADRKTLDRPGTARAIRLSMKGGTFAYERLWETDLEPKDYYATPVAHQGVLYAVSADGVLSAVNTATGELHYRKDLGPADTFYSSLVVAGGHLYLWNQGGKTWIFRVGAEGTLVAENKLDDSVWSTPFFHEGRIFVRGHNKLFCLGANPSRP
jgi:outer membrane protein assembly factor BamB